MEQLLKYFEFPAISPKNNAESLIKKQINYLINNDFEKLIYILYRVDVDENKIKKAVSIRNEDAAEIIYDLLKEREMEKELNRKNNTPINKNPDGAEWH